MSFNCNQILESGKLRPIHSKQLRDHGHKMVDFIADYYKNLQLETSPILNQVEPGYLSKLLPYSAPNPPESLQNVLDAASKSRIPGFGHNDATVDIHLESMNDPKKKEKELSSWEADLKRREKEIKRREDAVTQAGVPVDDKNWPPFFPILGK